MSVKIGILGATGLVGQTFIKQLEQEDWVGECRLFASQRSHGLRLPFADQLLPVLPIQDDYLNGCDILFGFTDGSISAPIFEKRLNQHHLIIDNASTFRLSPGVPLIIPEINLDSYQGESLIANPNCTTIELALLLAPLSKRFGIQQVFVCSYQSVSGSGQAGLDALNTETHAYSLGQAIQSPFYAKQIVANVIPQCDRFEGDFTLEELKIIKESSKILQQDFPIHPTCVRVPVPRGHHLAVTVALQETVSVDEMYEYLSVSPRLKCLIDYPASDEVVGRDEVFVSRIRSDRSKRIFSFWLSADNIRVGASTNALHIARALLKNNVRLSVTL